jgi:outer membrane protein W/TolB-like protein
MAHTVTAAEVRLAVLTFEMGEGVTQEQADKMADEFARQLTKMGMYDIVNRTQTAAPLTRAVFRPDSYPSVEAAARAAGTILKVNYVIAGTLASKDDKLLLNSWLVHVKSGGLLRRVQTSFGGTFDRFVKLGAEDNLRNLLATPEPSTPARPAVRESDPPVAPEPLRPSPSLLEREEGETREDTETQLPHITAGVRWTHMAFTSPEMDIDAALATELNELEADQDYSPLHNVFIAYEFSPMWGLELAWNRISATARDEGGNTDGQFQLDGPVLSLFFRLANESRITPYLGLGAAWYLADFKADGVWADKGGANRTMSMDDAPGFAGYLGTDVRLWKALYLDLLIRYIYVQTDVSLTGHAVSGGATYEYGPCTVPFSHVAAGVGVKWGF